MILAEKIVRLRKKQGMSQEELAEKMNVSRQAVSKWEGAQSIPDLDKILQLSNLFGVTTDYLLKEELEEEEFSGESEKSNIRHVSMEDANKYLGLRKTASLQIAVGTFLCIISVIPLFILSAASETPDPAISENLAGGLGLILLFLIVAPAVCLFTYCGFKSAPFEFLEKEPFETEYGVTGMVKEQQKAFHDTYVKFNIIGTLLCVLSPIPLFISVFNIDEMLMVLMLSLTLLIAGIGTFFFIIAGVRGESMKRLLKEGEYSEAEKKKKGLSGVVFAVYWSAVTAVYLGMLFLTDDASANWRGGYSWVIWPIAAVLFPAVMMICKLVENGRNKKDNNY